MEENPTQPGMNGGHEKHHHNTFWIDSQVSFTFTLQADTPTNRTTLHLDELQAFLKTHNFVLDLPYNPDWEIPNIYTFPDPETKQQFVVTFFRFDEVGDMAAAPAQADQMDHMDAQIGAQKPPLSDTPVARLVNLVNNEIQDRDRYKVESQGIRGARLPDDVPITSAAPHWLCGGSDNVTTGCPLTPPLPVETDSQCEDHPGYWPISLPGLPEELEDMRGCDVTVFVMDTQPHKADLDKAVKAASSHNLLLQDLRENVEFSRPSFKPPEFDIPGPNQVGTGKDITGEAMTFFMPDHGLFVAGIIRSIACEANIECIRILNDKAAGTLEMLTHQLHCILHRISHRGDLHNKDVVVNLSLVIPTDDDVKESHINLDLARTGFHNVIKVLASHKVVFVAAAGNEGDQRVKLASDPRPDALYPAAFAYDGIDNIIPVGAVKQDQHAASYSCYPGTKGVATYGGEIPCEGKNPCNDIYNDIDALIGVYTQKTYPKLRKDDPQDTYNETNSYGWAYWVGTSFATPIVTAVVARALELKRTSGLAMSIPDYILKKAATVPTQWDHAGGLTERQTIYAVQCKPTKPA